MKVKLPLLILIVFASMRSANAQSIVDSMYVISTSNIPLKSLKTGKVVYKIRPGDTIMLINIRIKPNYYIEVNDHRGIVSAKLLDSAINIKACVEYELNKLSQIDKYTKLYGAKWATSIVYHDIKLGMPATVVVAIKGNPTKVNRSVYTFGVHEQWTLKNKLLAAYRRMVK